MKKYLFRAAALVLALIAVLALFGCNGSGSENAKPTNTPVTGDPDTGKTDNTAIKTDKDKTGDNQGGTDQSKANKTPVPVIGLSVKDFPMAISFDQCAENNGFAVLEIGAAMEITANFGERFPGHWKIYVLETKPEDGAISVPEGAEPVLTESGASFTVGAGKYVLVLCEEAAAGGERIEGLTLTAAELG